MIGSGSRPGLSAVVWWAAARWYSSSALDAPRPRRARPASGRGRTRRRSGTPAASSGSTGLPAPARRSRSVRLREAADIAAASSERIDLLVAARRSGHGCGRPARAPARSGRACSLSASSTRPSMNFCRSSISAAYRARRLSVGVMRVCLLADEVTLSPRRTSPATPGGSKPQQREVVQCCPGA